MAVGYFGDVIFATSDNKILSFRDFKLTASASWGEHKSNGRKSEGEFLGPNNEKVTFTIELDAKYGVNPRNEIERLISYVENGTINPLVIGGKKVGSKWRTTNVSSSWGSIMSGGELVKASVTITIEEYVTHPAIITTTQTSQQTSQQQAAAAASGTTYTVVKGDSLWDIARRFYGSGSKYMTIYNANRGIIKNPSLIYPGQVLTIPSG